MTHYELLAICDNYSFKDSAEPVKVLRAVVELHKPIEKEERIIDGVNPAKVQVRICCQVCYDPRRYSYIEPYPCPTIQAIEKELR